jgi:hypothetical protein
MSDNVIVTIAGIRFSASLRRDLAPQSVARFEALLPYRQKLIHARWSGEACWIPLGDFDFNVGHENATSYPAPGELLLYPGGVSETELLLAYGPSCFASKAGQLAGNPLLRIVDKLDQLADIGRRVLWEGAKDILIERG